jgi:WD40 repeat protein/serine/threonine protein kinase/Tfp pilus assembly protein PilF
MSETAPSDNSSIEALVSQAADEFLQRLAKGEPADVEEYARRHPQVAEALRRVLPALGAVQGVSTPPPNPPLSELFVQILAGRAEMATGGGPLADVSPPSPWQGGRVGLAGAYEIVEEIGRGGMGVVYKARQVNLGRLVALKMILAGAHAGADERSRFRGEAESAARLRHPNIVQIYEVGEHEGCPFLAMEYCSGGTLADVLDGTPLIPAQAARLAETLGRAVHAAHQQRIVHRDLKPANVLLQTGSAAKDTWGRTAKDTQVVRAIGAAIPAVRDAALPPSSVLGPLEDCVPKIADFGLAKRLSGGPGAPATGAQTQTGAIVGTPSYMAPEQASARSKEVGPATDVYALGAILYELLTGRPPFKTAAPLDTVLQVIHDEPVPPRRLQPRVPRDLETVCLKCLQKDPARRYATAEALADDLRRFTEGRPVAARPVGSPERAWRWCRRNPVVAGLTACLFLALGGGLAGVTWKWLEADYQEGQARQAFVQARQKAEAERAAKESALHTSRELQAALYNRAIALAYHEWQSHNAGQAEQLVAECPPERRGWEWHYLYRLCHSDRQTLQGHEDALLAVAFSPDGTKLAAGSGYWGVDRPGEVIVWEAATGREWHTFKGHTLAVNSVAFSPDRPLLASAGMDHTVRIWDLAARKPAAVCRGHTGLLRSIAFGPGGRVASGSSDGTVRVWAASTGRPLLQIPTEGGEAMAVAFSPDGRLVAGGCKRHPHLVKLWDAQTGKKVRAFSGLTSDPQCLAFTRDGRRLACGGWDRQAKVWDVGTGRELITLRGHKGVVTRVLFSPEGRHLATASADGTIRFWNPDTGAELHILRGHTGEVTGAAFSPDGEHLATCGYDRRVKVWDVLAEQEARRLHFHGAHVYAMTFSADGKLLAAADGNVYLGSIKSVGVWDARTGLWLRNLKGHGGRVTGVAFSPRRHHLASSSTDATVKLWDAGAGRLRRTLRGHTGSVSGVAFSPDGKRLASAGNDGTVRLWETATGRRLGVLRGHAGAVAGVAFSPDGRRVASAGADGTVRVWAVAGDQQCRVLRGHRGAVNGVAFRAASDQLASAGADHKVIVWDAASGDKVRVLSGHGDAINGLAYNPAGDRLATVCHFDRTLRLWDAATGQQLLSFTHDEVLCVAFSPDGKRLATGAGKANATVRIWEGAASRRDDPWAAAARFRHYVGEKLWAKANTALARLRRKRGGDAHIWLAAGRVYQGADGWEQAADCLTRAVASGEDSAEAFFDLGYCEGKAGQWDQAIAAYGRALEREPGRPEAYNNRGYCHFRQGRYAEAFADYTAAIDHGPTTITPWRNRATVSVRLGRRDQAVADLAEAIRRHPADATLWQERADCLAELGKWREAAADYAAAGQRKADAPVLWFCRAAAHLAAEDLAGYRRICADMRQRFGKPETPGGANWVLFTCVLLPDALTDFNPLVQLGSQLHAKAPKHWYVLSNFGAALYRAGRYQKAISRLEDACRVHGNGGNAYNWFFLAMAHHRLENTGDARRWLAKAVQWVELATPSKIKDNQTRTPLHWSDRVRMAILRREAQILLSTEERPRPATENKPAR